MMAGGRERGSGAVWTLGVGAVLALAVTTLVLLAAAHHTRQLAAVAADMAALSAATVLPDDPAGACELASDIAGDHRGRLAECSVHGARVRVRVEVHRTALGFPLVAAAPAHAGPVAGAVAEAATPRLPPPGATRPVR